MESRTRRTKNSVLQEDWGEDEEVSWSPSTILEDGTDQGTDTLTSPPKPIQQPPLEIQLEAVENMRLYV